MKYSRDKKDKAEKYEEDIEKDRKVSFVDSGQ